MRGIILSDHQVMYGNRARPAVAGRERSKRPIYIHLLKCTMKKFLILDDNRLNRFLSTYLRGKGHMASSLTRSSTVEGWLEKNECDALILDLPPWKTEDGVALLQRIKAKYPSLRIIFFFTHVHDEEVLSQVRDFVDGYVSKGLGPSEIYYAAMEVFNK